jgi:hypothetical protein
MFTMAFAWDVPFGKGKRFKLDSKLADSIVGGWTLSSVFSAYTGTPFTISGNAASLNAPGNSQTADQIARVRKINEFGPGRHAQRLRAAVSLRPAAGVLSGPRIEQGSPADAAPGGSAHSMVKSLAASRMLSRT